MKRALTAIAAALREASDIRQTERLLIELFTAKELATLELRWRLLQDLFDGVSQRQIAERYHISLCKITRGSKVLQQRNSAIAKVLGSQRPGGSHEPDKPRLPAR